MYYILRHILLSILALARISFVCGSDPQGSQSNRSLIASHENASADSSTDSNESFFDGERAPTETRFFIQYNRRWAIIRTDMSLRSNMHNILPQELTRAVLQEILQASLAQPNQHTRGYDNNAELPNYDAARLIEENAHCPICIESHLQSGNQKTPGNHHRLACGHGICKTCWPQFSQTPSWFYEYAHRRYQYRCPMCRQFCAVANYYPIAKHNMHQKGIIKLKRS